MYSCMETLDASDTEGHQGHTPCVYTHETHEGVSAHIRAHSLKVLSSVGQEEQARTMKISWISLHMWEINYAQMHTENTEGVIFRGTHRVTR